MKGNITAKVVADSINAFGDRLTSLELHYPRFIHAEFLRHRMFSNSVSSSRAIPVNKMLDQIEINPAMPIYWGKNQSGMSASEEIEDTHLASEVWTNALYGAIECADELRELQVHKQITNRLVEPFQFINQVVTATDFDNFFYLRIDSAAQPEIQELARVMYQAMIESNPNVLRNNSYHMPYITDSMLQSYTIEECQKISASMCAQSSYRLADDSLEKAEMIYKKLVESRPLHASPFEHIASPFSEEENMLRAEHKDSLKRALLMLGQDEDYAEAKSKMLMYEGNFRGWSQMRKKIKNETCYNYER